MSCNNCAVEAPQVAGDTGRAPLPLENPLAFTSSAPTTFVNPRQEQFRGYLLVAGNQVVVCARMVCGAPQIFFRHSQTPRGWRSVLFMKFCPSRNAERLSPPCSPPSDTTTSLYDVFDRSSLSNDHGFSFISARWKQP